MNLFQIIFKQLRQRSLSTVLTIFSVALGVALATSILIIQREGDKLFGQTEYGYDIILGPKGSRLQLVLSNVYQVSEAQSTIPYAVYTDLATRLRREVSWAIPIQTGDTYRGINLLATQPKIFETPELAAARKRVQDEFAKARALAEPLRDPKNVPELPVPPNSPLLPRLFAMQQDLDALAKACAPFDFELPYLLESASADAALMVDVLAASDDHAELTKLSNRFLGHVGGAMAMIGGPVTVRPNEPFKFAQGRGFEVDKFECVLGAEAAQKTGLKIGDTFQATHGASEETDSADAHAHEENWVVVGILEPTQTAFDRVILIPLTGTFAIPEHGEAMAAMTDAAAEYEASKQPPPPPAPAHEPPLEQTPKLPAEQPAAAPATQAAQPGDDHDDHAGHDHAYHMEDGRIVLEVPREDWKLSSILVRSRGGQSAMQLLWDYRQTPDAMSVNPASEMREFSRTFLRGSSLVLLLLAILVSVVAAVSILVSIYNSIASRRREIAILRALGATRKRILTIICLEAGVIGLIGAVIGVFLGMGLAGVASMSLDRAMGQSLNWASLNVAELLYFVGAIVLAILAGLVPALKAYSTSVADNLVSE
jgi:putative ABC transport system permease protein